MGRVAVEKNLEAFLSLDLPGTKIVIGQGRRRPSCGARFPDAKFLGPMEGATLAAHLAAADVFVFPSKTDTFGVVQLEALACGVPVAAFPVTGPKDVIGSNPIGVLSDDLREACLGALRLSREACRAFALDTPGRTARGSSSAREFRVHEAFGRPQVGAPANPGPPRFAIGTPLAGSPVGDAAASRSQ